MVPAVSLNLLASVASTAASSAWTLADGAAQAAGAPAGDPGPLVKFMQSPFLPFLAVGLLIYFMMWRPQQKKQQEVQDWLKSLKKGDEVVTSGGVLGKVSKMGDSFVGVEVASGVEIQIQRSAVVQVMPKGTIK